MARSLGIGRVVVPAAPGVFSAVGLLDAQSEHHFVQTFFSRVHEVDLVALNLAYERMEAEAVRSLKEEGYEGSDVTWLRYADLRYVGQAYELTVGASAETLDENELDSMAERFQHEHERTYGHRTDSEPVELVNLRITARGNVEQSRPLRPMLSDGIANGDQRQAFFGSELQAADSERMLDLVVQAGTILDGTGGQRFRADVGVSDGRIVAVGDLADADSTRRLDAEGLLVAPGFIDIHSHSDFTLLIDPRAQSSIYQGVTTEVVGNCGHGCAPLTDPGLFTGNIYGYAPDVEIDWHSMSEYLARLDAAGPAVNVVSLVPNGNLRLAVLGMEDRPATEDEIGQMERLLEASLEEGAFGFSTGLEYPTERACSEEETIRLCRVVAQTGGLYATHTRNQ